MRTRRRGISELYASVLMIGATLSLGGFVASSAVTQFSRSTGSYSLAAAVQAASSGKQVSLVYGLVSAPGSGGCTKAYGGYSEGTAYVLVLYNFGSVGFTPSRVFDNVTLLSGGPYQSLAPGTMATYSFTLACAHSSGQTFLLVDSAGDEVQVGT